MIQENGQITIVEEIIISKSYYVRGKQVLLSHDLTSIIEI